MEGRTIILEPDPKFLEEFFNCNHTKQTNIAVTCLGATNQKSNYKTFFDCLECGARQIPRPSMPKEIQRYQNHLKQPIITRLAG